jgi:Polyketide cyclase / dehydrase and lipid transport
MRTWTATATAAAHPAAVLDVLTDPDACARWAPVPFDVESGRRLRAGTRERVSGRLAGKRVGFDVEVHKADETGLALSASGPVEFDVDYRLGGSQVRASISVRPRGGLTGRLLAEATGALLTAGALNHALSRLVTEANLAV